MSVSEFNDRANEVARIVTQQRPEVFGYNTDWRSNGAATATGVRIFEEMSRFGTQPCGDLRPLYYRWAGIAG